MKPLIILFAFFSFFFTCYSQLPAANADSLKAAPADTILQIKNLNTQDDFAKINEIIAIKLSTGKHVASFSTLYIDGIKVPGVVPWKISDFEKTVYFKYDLKVENMVTEFLGNRSTDTAVVPVFIAVGDSVRGLAKAVEPFHLEVRQKVKNISVWIWLMSLMLSVLIAMGLWKNILKDDNNLYYSLGRTQLLYWTVVFVVSYLFVYYKTDALPDIPGSALIILGISIGTTAASKVIENSTKEGIKIDTGAKSEGFFIDILSDGSSINIHRFQNVIFNIVFGLIFIQKTISAHVIPSFDDNVLMLLGISSGTYAGLKITEATKEQNKPAPQVGTDIAAPEQKKPDESPAPGAVGT